jgi:outer membrane protein OmpA-like peptidoglycan-associated protein
MRSAVLAALVLALMTWPAARQDHFAPDRLDSGLSIDIRSVNFKEAAPATDSQRLLTVIADDKQRDALIAARDILLNDPRIKFQVVGHTDDTECAAAACEALSLRRATLVHAWLLAEGVTPAQLPPVMGKGSRRPIDDNTEEQQRARNRRVEFELIL